MAEGKKYLYGPVPSRRLGRSLGVDIVPLKTCSLDCIYCQLGRSCRQTLERKAYVPVDDVLTQLRKHLGEQPQADYITICGSGEPTLHLELARLIDGIGKITDIPIAILTNGTLLWQKAVRDSCCRADVVLPSLDAGDQAAFVRINRPHKDLTLAKLVEGLCAFRAAFTGQIWLEVFMVEQINTDSDQISKIAQLITRIQPDKVQLNTAVRPTVEPGLEPVDPKEMTQILEKFASALSKCPSGAALAGKVEIIADYESAGYPSQAKAARQTLLAMLKRRPCTLSDICSSLGLAPNEALKHISMLEKEHLILEQKTHETTFFLGK